MRVLVVDDDQRLAANLSRAFELSGIATDVVLNGTDAIAAASTSSYDAMVMDRMLPGMDGIEVVRRLRQRRVAAPILMLTARDSVNDRISGLDAGADDYLTKPFALGEVVARIRALTRRHLPERSAILSCGPLVLDVAGHRLTINESPVELTGKEFSILEYLLLNVGRPLSRSQILEHVWNQDLEGGQNLVEVYIGRLRAKMAKAGVAGMLVTLRGVGYRLQPPPS